MTDERRPNRARKAIELSPERAREEGREARRERKPLDAVPMGYLATKSLAKAWREGWQEQARADALVKHGEPDVRVADELVTTREARPADPHRWPEGKPLPTTYVRQVVPCPSCRRVTRDDGGKAALLSHTFGRHAFFLCSCCGERWKLDVERP